MAEEAAESNDIEADPPEGGGDTGPAPIRLPSKLDFRAARKMYEELLAAREQPHVVLDASGVEYTSSAAVLVVVSFLNARTTMTPPAAVISPTGGFIDAFSELGFFGTLMRMEFRT